MITICVALEAELPDFKMNGYTVIYTGVGKVQAATALAKSLCHFHKPIEIWNYGTAGGVSGISGLHEVGAFLQRDYQAFNAHVLAATNIRPDIEFPLRKL